MRNGPKRNIDFVSCAALRLRDACKGRKEDKATIVELMSTRELGDLFRRDALKVSKRLLKKYKAYSADR